MGTFGLSKGALGDPGGGEVEDKTGGEELNGDRGAQNKPKQNKQEQKRKRRDRKGTLEAFRSLMLAPPGLKYKFYLHNSNVFACPPWVLGGAPGRV